MRWLVLLVALLLAGCSSPDSDSGATGASSDSSTTDAAPVPPVDAPPASAIGSTRNITFEGYLAHGTCVPSGLNSCQGTGVPSQPIVPPDDSSNLAGLDPGTYDLDITLEYSSIMGTSEELALFVQPYVACGGGMCSTGEGVYAAGSSPVHLEATGFVVPADAAGVMVSVHHLPEFVDTPAGTVVYNVHTDHPFQVDGLATRTA